MIANRDLFVPTSTNNVMGGGAAVAQWIRLRLPPATLGSNSKHTIYTFINLNCGILKKTKINRKRDRDF